ncbi:MAG TPA: protein translocase subunit SecD [Anaerolineae bacterium]|nr:protein translocase subunit SecD [Anaerolineae bacterium]
MSSRTRVWLLVIVVLTAAVVFIDAFSAIDPKLGLDLSGGTQVLLEAVPVPGQTLDPVVMEQTRQIVENRVNAFGLTEPLVQLAGTNRILVELPNEKDPARAVDTIQQTGQLEFVEVDRYFEPGAILRTSNNPTPTNVLTPTQPITPGVTPTATPTVTDTEALTPTVPANTGSLDAQFGPVYRTLFTGAQLVPERLGIATGQLGEPQVAFELKPEAAQLFADYTRNNVGGYLCIVLDNRVNSCPTIRNEIPNGQGVIEMGAGGLEEAQQLLTVLRYGALPVSLQVVQSNIIGPALGEDSIRASVIAGIIGLSAVGAFMLLYYRVAGVVAVTTLALYGLTTFALFKIIPVTLTLPGIAGFILSVAVAVDGNTLIFERMKEELRNGRRLGIAVDVGFERAWSSIRDSNISTLITCVILFWFGNQFGASIVKGFAVTLAIGVALSLFTSIQVTRTLLHLIIDNINLEGRPRLFGA